VSETGSKSYATWQLNKSQKVDEPKSQRIRNPIERGTRRGSEKGFKMGGKGFRGGYQKNVNVCSGAGEWGEEAAKKKREEQWQKLVLYRLLKNKCNVTAKRGEGRKKGVSKSQREGKKFWRAP